jgi:hypothetical protein
MAMKKEGPNRAMHAWINARQRHRLSQAEAQTARQVNVIQASGAFGSRQKETQRLGWILRPQWDGCVAHVFTPVSRDIREEEFAHHRKLFLTEQGYFHQGRLIDRI